jgi:hypothetical protein
MADPIVEERHYHRADHTEDTSVMSTVLALLAVLLIVGFALYVFRVYPFNAGVANPAGTNNQYDINVTTPDLTPDAPVTPTNP